MALKLPPSLKLSHLKSLAFQCGISTSGTKALLTDRLIDEIVPALPDHGPKRASPTRILSIDMGIRNLAYCILDVPPDRSSTTKASIPSVVAWRRIAVSSAPIPSQDIDSAMPAAKEAFDPQTLSAAAYTLLRHTLLPHNPTHVLIERQRFRSMGSPHILEWTIRVNMFESMLYAVLQTLRQEKVWHGNVTPILPGKVGPFWIEKAPNIGVSTGRTRNTNNAKLLNKGLKIDLVRSWLVTNQMLSLGTPEVESTAQAYLDKWHRLPGRAKKKSAAIPRKEQEVEEMGKLDDLADSLLQGMAWIEWEKNKRKVLKNGIEAINIG
jgi:cruciform cutting endonuclease 1